MSSSFAFYQRFSKEVIILYNDMEEAIIKFEPGKRPLVKFKNKLPFPAIEGSKVVADAIIAADERTQDEFDAF